MSEPNGGLAGAGGKLSFLRHGASAFTWSLAHRVCLARQDHPPELMIDEEWLTEWLGLSFGAPGCNSFPVSIIEKVTSLGASYRICVSHGMALSAVRFCGRRCCRSHRHGWRILDDTALILLFGMHPLTAVGTDLLYAAVTKTAGTTG